MKQVSSPSDAEFGNFLKLGFSFFLYTVGAAILLGAVGYFIGIVEVTVDNDRGVSNATLGLIIVTLFLVFATFVAICLSIAYWLFPFARKAGWKRSS